MTFLFISVLLIALLLIVQSTTTENKVIRSKSSNFLFSPNSSQSNTQSSTERTRSNAKSTFHPATALIKQSSDQLPQKLQRLASDFKYEVLDCFDAIVYAESNAEVIIS
jgi:hypothetical protein